MKREYRNVQAAIKDGMYGHEVKCRKCGKRLFSTRGQRKYCFDCLDLITYGRKRNFRGAKDKP